MSQKTTKSSRKPISSDEINDWTNLIDSIPMEPLEREIYAEHIKAMQEFQGKRPVDPKSIPSNIEEDECSVDDEDEPKEETPDEEKDERLKQRDQAKQDFEEVIFLLVLNLFSTFIQIMLKSIFLLSYYNFLFISYFH